MSNLLRETSAFFSEDRQYRYKLTRSWDPKLPPLCVGMLNPSMADERVNDPTIGRCERRAMRLGCGSLWVWNLFAFRATDPKQMMAAADPVGPLNDGIILTMLRLCKEQGGIAMVGWGNHGTFQDRHLRALALAGEAGVDLHCLGVTASLQPRHPLYIANGADLRPWPQEARS